MTQALKDALKSILDGNSGLASELLDQVEADDNSELIDEIENYTSDEDEEESTEE